MLWRITIHNRLVHPDFIRDRITERQFQEIWWYWKMYPFGHDIDHQMQARIAAAMSGKSEDELMPRILDQDEYLSELFPGSGDGDNQNA